MSTVFIFIAVIAGIIIGYLVKFNALALKLVDGLLSSSLYFLLFVMGLKIGLNQELLRQIPVLGLKALVLCLAAIAGSVACVVGLERIFFRNARMDVYYPDEQKQSNKRQNNKMTIKILIAMILGTATAIFLPSIQTIESSLDNIVMLGLMCMTFTSGIGIGNNKEALLHLKESGFGLFIVPLGIAIGSIGACLIVAPIVRLPFFKSASVGACMGWYTLGGIMIGEVDAQLGTIAFMSNLMREIFAFICIPWVAKHFGSFAAVAPAGSTAMDTTLPVIVRNTSYANMIIAFSTGVILSVITPFLLGLLTNLF